MKSKTPKPLMQFKEEFEGSKLLCRVNYALGGCQRPSVTVFERKREFRFTFCHRRWFHRFADKEEFEDI